MWVFGYRVSSRIRFLPFFFFLRAWTVTSHGFTVHALFGTVHALFSTVYVLKNIKNRSHDTIYTIKNYFATVFSVFSFQFSVFSNNKLNPNGPIVSLFAFFLWVSKVFHVLKEINYIYIIISSNIILKKYTC